MDRYLYYLSVDNICMTVRYRCYRCGEEGETQAKRKRFECSNCNKTIDKTRSRIFFFSNASARRLARGPAMPDEVSMSQSFSPVVEKLKIYTTGRKKRPPLNTSTIYYLPGDERAAIRMFMAENEDFVRDCLQDKYNILKKALDDYMWEMLLEEWYWLGYGMMRNYYLDHSLMFSVNNSFLQSSHISLVILSTVKSPRFV